VHFFYRLLRRFGKGFCQCSGRTHALCIPCAGSRCGTMRLLGFGREAVRIRDSYVSADQSISLGV
jgi:hypothetical protein